MAKDERDSHTGYLTTGHEWNGITELNTPVPRVIFFFLISTVLFSLGYWVLMPTWPLGTTFTKGILGADQRAAVSESLKQAALDRATWTNLIEKESYARIQADPQLMEMVRTTGRTLFGDNCAACHGREAKGGKGFPNLTTNAWLWGGSPEAMAETIRVGINSSHPDSRVSQMPAFGRDRILERPDMENVLAYVLSLSKSAASDVPAGKVSSGKALFASNCASCHGDDARGKTDVGAPDLTDAVWIYGGDAASVYTTIWGGRQGHMPTWEARLSPTDRKILALYLIDLRKTAP
ncbi:cytochrome-c oxidase, cbb3-type subunit III [Enhydrobacter sp.]|jgi:cytochrome c oxidase cbb3-type subunit 3|uniref:cytochrome-c oxidase, cbb3-type subunit III n=1 Tax=Enhydrobacter sp. TaxID=1894999 RepID=UPI00260805F5|nr:cytochrome-c oxidase, cbb3-type subunit III [Enhydrobacter sp.]WIM11945.1 MAG: Cytochrome c oxidase (cbb3-type) subunit CcoP [Enhydrobacter sp.]